MVWFERKCTHIIQSGSMRVKAQVSKQARKQTKISGYLRVCMSVCIPESMYGVQHHQWIYWYHVHLFNIALQRCWRFLKSCYVDRCICIHRSSTHHSKSVGSLAYISLHSSLLIEKYREPKHSGKLDQHLLLGKAPCCGI